MTPELSRVIARARARARFFVYVIPEISVYPDGVYIARRPENAVALFLN